MDDRVILADDEEVVGAIFKSTPELIDKIRLDHFYMGNDVSINTPRAYLIVDGAIRFGVIEIPSLIDLNNLPPASPDLCRVVLGPEVDHPVFSS